MALSACVSCKIRHFVAFRWHDASQVVWSLLPEPIYVCDLTPLITDVANGKPASVLHMLSSHVCIAVDANSSYLSNHAQSMRRRERDADSLHRVSRQAVQAQVVAALVIRDAVGDVINRPQAAVKPGPWPGRRAAGEALSRGLASSHLEPSGVVGQLGKAAHVAADGPI